MLEVVFNESASVSLMMAQKYGNGDYYMKGSTPGFAFYGGSEPTEEEIEKLKSDWMREKEEKWAKAVPLGGSKADIFCFDLLLQIGGLLDLRIGVPDSWIRYRLDSFVENGDLKIVEMDYECPWIRVLKRKEQ